MKKKILSFIIIITVLYNSYCFEYQKAAATGLDVFTQATLSTLMVATGTYFATQDYLTKAVTNFYNRLTLTSDTTKNAWETFKNNNYENWQAGKTILYDIPQILWDTSRLYVQTEFGTTPDMNINKTTQYVDVSISGESYVSNLNDNIPEQIVNYGIVATFGNDVYSISKQNYEPYTKLNIKKNGVGTGTYYLADNINQDNYYFYLLQINGDTRVCLRYIHYNTKQSTQGIAYNNYDTNVSIGEQYAVKTTAPVTNNNYDIVNNYNQRLVKIPQDYSYNTNKNFNEVLGSNVNTNNNINVSVPAIPYKTTWQGYLTGCGININDFDIDAGNLTNVIDTVEGAWTGVWTKDDIGYLTFAGTVTVDTSVTDVLLKQKAGTVGNFLTNFWQHLLDILKGVLQPLLDVLNGIGVWLNTFWGTLTNTMTDLFVYRDFDYTSLQIPNTIINKFPFCIPFDIKNAVAGLLATPQAPKWIINFDNGIFRGGGQIEIDFAIFEPFAVVIRWGIYLIFLFGIVIITRNIIQI